MRLRRHRHDGRDRPIRHRVRPRPGQPHRHGRRRPVERTPVHGSFTTPLTVTEALAIAEREGWPSGLIDNGPFQVVNVWLEGTQLLELFPADLVGDYLALYGPDGRDILDPGLRALEASLRG